MFLLIRQYYLPDYDLVTKDYLKELLAGTRGYIKLENLKPVSMPYWGEIGVKHQYQKALKLPNMAFYFPRKLPKGKQMNKKYFFDVFHTLHPQIV